MPNHAFRLRQNAHDVQEQPVSGRPPTWLPQVVRSDLQPHEGPTAAATACGARVYALDQGASNSFHFVSFISSSFTLTININQCLGWTTIRLFFCEPPFHWPTIPMLGKNCCYNVIDNNNNGRNGSCLAWLATS